MTRSTGIPHGILLRNVDFCCTEDELLKGVKARVSHDHILHFGSLKCSNGCGGQMCGAEIGGSQEDRGGHWSLLSVQQRLEALESLRGPIMSILSQLSPAPNEKKAK